MTRLEIIKATRDTVPSLESVNALIEQLTSSKIVLDRDTLMRLIDSESSSLYLLYKEDTLAGMLTLCSYLCPTGKKCWIEDVVVDKAFRGQGLGRLLIAHAVEETKKMGKVSLMLTSRPSRVAANKLYQSAGFEQRETNVYRMKIED